MSWLQQFSSYYSPLLGTVPDNTLSRRTKNGLLTSLVVLPKLGSQYWFQDNLVVQPNMQFLQRTGSLQWKVNKLCFMSSSEAQKLPTNSSPVAEEIVTEMKTWMNTRGSVWRGRLLGKSILWYLIPPQYFPVLTALLHLSIALDDKIRWQVTS